ncbi:MAG: hypothetical protein AB7V77_02950 [Candidatus Woesearchaeota archaeon]
MKEVIITNNVFKSHTLTKVFNNRFNNVRLKTTNPSIQKYQFNYIAG